MKTNKGYYSWVHSLNNSALVSHKKGHQMLIEQQNKKLTEATIHPDDARDAISRLASEKTGAHSIDLAGGDPLVYRREKNRQRAEEAEKLARYNGPIDVEPEGNANAVADDAEDGVMGDPPLTRLPTFNVPDEVPPTRVHPEPLYTNPESANAAVRAFNAGKNFTVDNNNSNYDYSEPDDEGKYDLPSTNWRTVKESVSQKINRILRS